MDLINIQDKFQFLKYSNDKAEIYFSTGKGDLDFNISKEEGIKNIQLIKQWFNVKEVGYLNQIHSNLVYNYDGIIHQGDGIVTSKKSIALGVFTADCVPILLYDNKNQVIAAVHSGWKSTYLNIIKNTLNKMKSEYGSSYKNIFAYIGPHNKGCCYEVGEDLKEKFRKLNYFNEDIFKDNKLDLLQCIKTQLLKEGLLEENIRWTETCTFCHSDPEFHSYRKSGKDSGRMFSFIFIK